MRALVAVFALLVPSCAMAQSNGPDPTFTFTPAHGNKIVNGRFSPGGTLSLIDEFDGKLYPIEIRKIDRMTLTARKGPADPKCGASSQVLITFLDGTRQRGCFAPSPLAFEGSTAVPSVTGMVGKFVRDKR
ncbi:MAG TPA: hypothetical protein VH639_13330 [Bryobacteraceae bacterium]|jgi:hypothetical protein